tara:strand:+ start:421 stop:732 length:312 start_codon:yes stop_codon:yes gene_type:complete
MKHTFIIITFILASIGSSSVNAQVKNTCLEKGTILHFDSRKCGGCWGWTIALKNDTIKTDELNAKTFGYDFSKPMPIRLTVGKINKSAGSRRYYEILCAIKEE